MPKLYLGEALGLLGKTLPFIWIRLGSYMLLGLGLGAYFAVVGGFAWLLGQLWAPLGFILFLIGIGGSFAIVRWITRYYFYLLKAAHTAVMTEFIVHGSAPQGGQVAYGRKAVTDRFKDTSIMFAVDVMVDGIVKRIVRSVVRIASILPIPGIDSLGKLLERVAIASSTYVDESILSRAYAKKEQNVWSVAHEGVVLYAQAWKPIVANAVVLSLIGYVEFFVLLVLLGLPALAINAVFPVLGPALAIFVFLAAWMIKLAVADAWSLAATLLAYHRTTLEMTPDPEWVARLEGMSDKFKELGQKAKEAVETRTSSFQKEGEGDGGAASGASAPGAEGASSPVEGAAEATVAAGAATAQVAAAASEVAASDGPIVDEVPPARAQDDASVAEDDGRGDDGTGDDGPADADSPADDERERG